MSKSAGVGVFSKAVTDGSRPLGVYLKLTHGTQEIVVMMTPEMTRWVASKLLNEAEVVESMGGASDSVAAVCRIPGTADGSAS